MSEHTIGPLEALSVFPLPHGKGFIVSLIAPAPHSCDDDVCPAKALGATREEALANAERLALCWNSHDDLVAASEAASDAFDCIANASGPAGRLAARERATTLLDVALAKAEPKPKIK